MSTATRPSTIATAAGAEVGAGRGHTAATVTMVAATTVAMSAVAVSDGAVVHGRRTRPPATGVAGGVLGGGSMATISESIPLSANVFRICPAVCATPGTASGASMRTGTPPARWAISDAIPA